MLVLGLGGTGGAPATWLVDASTVPSWLPMPSLNGSIAATATSASIPLSASTGNTPEKTEPYETQLNITVFSTQTVSFAVPVLLFLTAATDGALKLWDVRDPSASRGHCVQVWTAHTNRVHPIGAALSACGRFAACGSEDKLAYVYDLRRNDGMGGKEVLWKLRGHTDAVLDVAFNPVHPQLATVGADAKLLFFCDG